MGIGDPVGILQVIALGVDMFDCVLPTRLARHGMALTAEGRLNLKNASHRRYLGPLDPECSCEACTGYSRAYLSHLVRENELLAHRLVTLHNVHFVGELCQRARAAISEARYGEFMEAWVSRYQGRTALSSQPSASPRSADDSGAKQSP
jgi:queuine tRNA-ribosyltransferase